MKKLAALKKVTRLLGAFGLPEMATWSGGGGTYYLYLAFTVPRYLVIRELPCETPFPPSIQYHWKLAEAYGRHPVK